MFLKCCLNGPRSRDSHPALPVMPEDLAWEARAGVAAGAQALHLHPRDGGRAGNCWRPGWRPRP
ncbi:3-keto-5-aminohexanoate cleavage protein [Deinococcus hopiensis]|uniref:3-keto-5-aminohexanoate cleavage protein n=1 Tax=Deinococcus hopiensis TaxID=309885 RepID=UPI0009FDEA45|nr:3-keto-5-aminohexanoate cleavage protein [Deinococcus hopiensis]